MNLPCAVGERRKSRKCPLGHCHESNGLTDNMNKGTTSYWRADDCHGNARKKGLFQMDLRLSFAVGDGAIQECRDFAVRR